MLERTLVLVKPDGVTRGLVGEIIGRRAEQHYQEHADKPFFAELVDFVTSGPLVAAVLEGPDVIAAWRTMMGATNPISAAPGTIRADFATVMRHNIVHGSDSLEAAEREIKLFFPSLRV